MGNKKNDFRVQHCAIWSFILAPSKIIQKYLLTFYLLKFPFPDRFYTGKKCIKQIVMKNLVKPPELLKFVLPFFSAQELLNQVSLPSKKNFRYSKAKLKPETAVHEE